jgi:hypothetical protein
MAFAHTQMQEPTPGYSKGLNMCRLPDSGRIFRVTKLNAFFARGMVVILGMVLLVLQGCDSGVGSSSQGKDPAVNDSAVVYVKRELLFSGDDLIGDYLQRPERFQPGGVLFLKQRATPSATPRDITSAVFADPVYRNEEGKLLYDVKDLAVSYDGSKLLFAMRAPAIPGGGPQPAWNIWEYQITTGGLRRVMASDTVAESGHDIGPSYLPDGRIVFSSTRQQASRAVLLEEGKRQFAGLEESLEGPAFVLHTMEPDGSNIQQITFNQSHDLDPVVLADGRIMFTRWDRAGSVDGMNLYTVNPDGSGLTLVYGRHSHDTGTAETSVQFIRPQEMSNGDILVQLRDYQTNQFEFVPTRVHVNTHTDFAVSFSGSQDAGQTSLIEGLRTDEEAAVAGQYSAVFPLQDGSGRLLVSWSPCRLIAEDQLTLPDDEIDLVICTDERIQSRDYVRAYPVYGIWIVDQQNNTRRPIDLPVDDYRFDEAVVMTSRPLATSIPPLQPAAEAAELATEGYGIVEIRSVYDVEGVDSSPAGIAATADPSQASASQRPARFIRVEKPVSIPTRGVRQVPETAYGVSNEQLMREILGYVPVEPDGSVRFAVPAKVAFAISVLDAEGRRISNRHQNWLQVTAGETLRCNGCHTAASTVPHGRPEAEPATVNVGASTSGLPFPNTNPLLLANIGETMAETWARNNGTRRLAPDMLFSDEWVDSLTTAAVPDFAYAYSDLQTTPPISAACADNWTAGCRVVINYETHLHPLWSLDRRVFDEDGVTEIPEKNRTCIACHSPRDRTRNVRVPAAQLDLSNGLSADVRAHFRSYRELLVADNEQEVVNGALVDRQLDTGRKERDSNGTLVPVYATVPVNAVMKAAGALASAPFMDIFATGGSHAGYLSPAELKLISEWLDIGAQYYNNPFDLPQN